MAPRADTKLHRFKPLRESVRAEAARGFERWAAARASRTASPRWLAAVQWWRGPASAEPGAVLDAFVVELGHRPPGQRWREVGDDAARAAFDRVMRAGLAYGGSVLSADELGRRAATFFELLPAPRRCFVAGDLTDATFDEGLAVIAGDVVGLVWQVAED